MMAQLELVHPAPLELTSAQARADHQVITHLVDQGARVLDIGCGDGALIKLLTQTCNARGSGLERDPGKVRACVARGLSVAQGDADVDLGQFPTGAFDTVIFSHSLMHLNAPRAALREAGRIGARVIVTIANAAHWRARLRLLTQGRTGTVWAEPAAARPIGVRDLAELARDTRLSIESAVPITRGRAAAPFAKTLWRANWFAEEAVFLLAP